VRILLISLDMDPSSQQGDKHTGAAHLYVKETLEMLVENNIPTVVVTRLDSTDKAAIERIGSVTIWRVPIGNVVYTSKEYLWKREKESCNRILDTLRNEDFHPDLIHAVYWYSGAAALELEEYYPDVPLIYTIVSLGKVKHGWKGQLDAHDLAREKTEQRLFEQADLILAVSQQEKANAVRLYNNVRGEKIVVIGRGVDPNLYTPSLPFLEPIADVGQTRTARPQLYQPPPQQKVILFIGRLIASKGYVRLLEFYDELLRDPSINTPPLWIVGGDSGELDIAWTTGLTTDSLRLAHDTGQIWWWGAVPRSLTAPLYQRALVTCIPSYYEPGARVILESMACGTPVIMSPTGYSDELVYNGFNGFVTDLDDKQSWVSYLKGLIRDRAWRDIIAYRAYYSVLPYYSLHNFKERQLKAIEARYAGNDNRVVERLPDLSRAHSVSPYWEVPPSFDTQPSPTLPYLEAKVGRLVKQLAPDFVTPKLIEQDKGNSSTSNFLVSADNKMYWAKLFIDKTRFHNLFWPTPKSQPVRAASARYNCERLFWDDRLFLSPIAHDEEDLSCLFEAGQSIPASHWTTSTIADAFAMVGDFHTRQHTRFKKNLDAISAKLYSVPEQWNIALDQYRLVQEWNGVIRGGGLWHTPAKLELELAVLLLALEKNIWSMPEDLRRRLRSNAELIFEYCLKNSAELYVVWGECRAQHFIKLQDESLMAIDAETAQLGEREHDYACFLWWLFDPRSSVISANTVRREVYSIFNMWNDNSVQMNRVLGWFWLQSLYWYLWDKSRGVRRYANYTSIIGASDFFDS